MGCSANPCSPPDNDRGLTAEQVKARLTAGLVNKPPPGLTPSVSGILLRNILTPFNCILTALAILLVLVNHAENALFFGIVLCNTAMGIIQELRAKRTLGKLSILARGKVTVLRDDAEQFIERDKLVLHDVLRLTPGTQICADAVLLQSHGLEVNEALLTGEPDPLPKAKGARLLSGSFVVAGGGTARVMAVGRGNYAAALTAEAQRMKPVASRLLRTLNNIIKVVTLAILPIGGLLFYTEYRTAGRIPDGVLAAAAAMNAMIPQGLVLLTGVTLTVGALSLAKRRALVQSLHSIETLARVDVLCLDKTGTLTDGTLRFEQALPAPGVSLPEIEALTAQLMGVLPDDNPTACALRNAMGTRPAAPPNALVPFSSARKWSGVTLPETGTLILGAPQALFPDQQAALIRQADRHAAEGYRVLCLARSDSPLQGQVLPPGLEGLALFLFTDTLRDDAADTFQFFKAQGVALKVISGDHPLTVSRIAQKAGLDNPERAVDMSQYSDREDLSAIAEDYTVFGRVSPLQKRALIRALQQQGHTACMTGDGVNDILAMKAADCSVAMLGGSEAARGVCDFVLLSDGFSSMIHVLREGRRVINNIELVSCLYLIQTVYGALLSLLYILLPYPFPFVPIQLTPINAITVGIPTFFLALRHNYNRPTGQFIEGFRRRTLPAALTVTTLVLLCQGLALLLPLSLPRSSTINVFLIGLVGFMALYQTARPHNRPIRVMLSLLFAGFLLLFLLSPALFDYAPLLNTGGLSALLLSASGFLLFWLLGKCFTPGQGE